jgi:hypothetical protein
MLNKFIPYYDALEIFPFPINSREDLESININDRVSEFLRKHMLSPTRRNSKEIMARASVVVALVFLSFLVASAGNLMANDPTVYQFFLSEITHCMFVLCACECDLLLCCRRSLVRFHVLQ